MTTDWSKTWAGANGWYDGYDSTNTGSFVDISQLSGDAKTKAVTAVRENIIGLLEQKGVTRAQILDPTSDVGKFYQTQMTNAASGSDNATRDAFQSAAQHTTSNVDRGNKWGADTDDTMGRTFLSKGVTSSTTIDDLYKKGFGRDADATGKAYWEAQLASGKHTIESIATEFGRSEEANIRSTYSDEYGRDADAGGLNYWMMHKSAAGEDHNAFDASQLVKDTIAARGANAQTETVIRDAGWQHLGQASSQAQRNTMPNLGSGKLFTDMATNEVIDWIEEVRAGTKTIDDVKKIIYDRGDRMDAHNQYDSDDWDEEKYPGGPNAQPTGMGRFASLDEIQATIDSGETPDEIRARLAKSTWGALTHEKQKFPGQHGSSDDLRKHADKWFGNTPDADTTYTKQPDFQPTIPTKPGIPGKLPVDRTDIEYMPDLKADTFSSTPYKDAKTEFNIEQGKKQTPTTLAAPTVAQRFTGTSAKGVRIKRSKASRMGTIRGTKQLGREQQTKSLNI